MSAPADPTLAALLAEIVQAVAELPDRTSPDDWPEAMLVTADELSEIVRPRLLAAAARLLRQQEEALEKVGWIWTQCGCCGKHYERCAVCSQGTRPKYGLDFPEHAKSEEHSADCIWAAPTPDDSTPGERTPWTG